MQIFQVTKRVLFSSILLAAFLAGLTGMKADESPESWTIKKIMADTHKGEHSVVKRAIRGEASDQEVKQLLAYYLWMEKQEPPRGSMESWKEKMEPISKSAIYLAAEKAGAAELFQKAVSCKACHNEHKPE